MDNNILKEIVELRLCIGFLGEATQGSWWQSSFFSASSGAFLSPVFGKTTLLTQYHGVREAATRVHDQHIGIGKDVFHLFRLPELVEMEMHRFLQDPNNVAETRMIVATRAEAEQFFQEYAKDLGAEIIGPVRLGGAEKILTRETWQVVAGHYLKAFQGGTRVFPYFSKAA